MSDSAFVQGNSPLTHSLDVSTPNVPVENGGFNSDDYFVWHDLCLGNIRLVSPEPTVCTMMSPSESQQLTLEQRNANASLPEAQPSTETINPADLTTLTTPEWSPSPWDTGTQASRKRKAK